MASVSYYIVTTVEHHPHIGINRPFLWYLSRKCRTWFESGRNCSRSSLSARLERGNLPLAWSFLNRSIFSFMLSAFSSCHVVVILWFVAYSMSCMVNMRDPTWYFLKGPCSFASGVLSSLLPAQSTSSERSLPTHGLFGSAERVQFLPWTRIPMGCNCFWVAAKSYSRTSNTEARLRNLSIDSNGCTQAQW